ncbi:hypothetical protein [Dokdonia sp. Hel_I_53]|uniref:hypothetical protein n=1 Tax=Dokdonia sp. Hel_I_53 TaxID=1566287 RepID=UPI00119AC986|nr:hypothetical protein [Dokdonia sp. Hel_I_53]TVZ52644.1 hypothetical protein OD90_1826 [Dokdonia sp. Hel_I_53]
MKYVNLLLFLLFSITLAAQGASGSGNYNRIGLQGRIALLDINTSDFQSEKDVGFIAGLTTRGRIYNDFSMVYGIDFLSSSVNIQTIALGETQSEDTRFNVIGAQLNLLLSYNLIDKHLAIDFGPALLINGKMKVDGTSQENNIVSGYTTLTASDIQEISRINGFGVVGLTGGFERVRLILQYQYGFTNILNNLNKQGLLSVDPQATGFKGTASILSAGLVFYL